MSAGRFKIVIVGGGSAGWMTAATLAKACPDKDITLIESPNIPIVGVGESTLGQINNWLNYMGIEDKEFMKEHYDHIHSLFDGTDKGIPILSIVGLLNDNFTGGGFCVNGKDMKLKKGDIIIFPSNFLKKKKNT